MTRGAARAERASGEDRVRGIASREERLIGTRMKVASPQEGSKSSSFGNSLADLPATDVK
jgi:hypothetical protein